MKGHFYGIGVGPGEPELLTMKAVNVLKSIDVLAVPASKQEKSSIAYETAKPFIPENTEILSLTFPMIQDREQKNTIRKENASIIKEYLDRGKSVAFITIGDPLTYSTYIYLLEHLKKGDFPITTIPGITSFQAIASKVNLPLTIGDEKMAVFCDLPEPVNEGFTGLFDTYIFMKPAKYLTRLLSLFNS